MKVLGCEVCLCEDGSDRPNVLRKDHAEGATPSMGAPNIWERPILSRKDDVEDATNDTVGPSRITALMVEPKVWEGKGNENIVPSAIYYCKRYGRRKRGCSQRLTWRHKRLVGVEKDKQKGNGRDISRKDV